MADDWNTLEGTAHSFLYPTYQMVRVLLEDLVQRPALYDLHSQINLTKVNMGEDWTEFAEHYHGYLTCLAVSLSLLLVLIVGGVTFCCCRCCPCCRKCRCCCCKKSTPVTPSKKRSSGELSTSGYCCSLFFFVLLMLMTMGIVIMFVSNPLVDEEVKDRTVYGQLLDTTRELQDVIDSTVEEVANTTLGMYRTVQDGIIKTLDTIPSVAMTAIETATAVTSLLNKQREFFQTIEDCSNVVDDTRSSLEDDAMLLQKELDELKADINNLLPECALSPACNESLQAMRVSVNYTSLDTFNDSSVAASQAERSVQETEQDISNIEDDIYEQIESAIQGVDEALDAGYEGLATFMHNTTSKTDLGLVDKVEQLEDNEARDVIEDYWDLWFYCMIGLTVVLTLIVVLYLVGLVCGICGKKPRKGGLCNKSKAPCLLMASVYLLLIFSTLVVLVSLVLLIIGGLLHTEVCRYFEEPVEYKLSLNTLDEIIVTHTEVDVHIINAIDTCGDGYTLYEALKLDDLEDLNLNETLNPDSYGITDALDDLSNVDVTIGNVTLVQPATLSYTAVVNQSLRAKDYGLYLNVMLSNITEGNLTAIADSLMQYSPNSTNLTEFQRCLQEIRDLESSVSAMEDKHALITRELHRLKSSTGEDPMDDQLRELQEAETKLQSEGDELISGVLLEITSEAVTTVYDGLVEIADTIRYRVGDCGPLHNTAYGFLSYICVDVLYPLNAFWFGLGWFLTFSVISMFTACKLAGIFRSENAVSAAGAYYKSRSKRASTYTPSDDLYMNNFSTLNLPDASFQHRDQPNSPVLVSYIDKDSALGHPYSVKDTSLEDHNANDWKQFYC